MAKFPQHAAPDYNVAVITGNTEVNIPGATYFVGAANLATAAQTATIAIYDGASVATGTLIAAANALAVNGTLAPPAPGIPLVGGGGLTYKASAAPTTGVAVYWR
jgi:hypothetical protein